VRAAILALLREQSRNGYQIIQEIERRSGGLWRPSAG
jgi:DNA-binding PadR family transcriptional regulator